jgi:hypothetical protein
MAAARNLPILGGLALIGVAGGFHLGWSAIGEINPLYFSRAETGSSFHADLVPNRSYNAGLGIPQIDEADELALGSGCIGCRDYPVDPRPIPDPAIERIYAPREEAPTSSAIELAAYEQEAPEQATRRKADLERVELYSRAPVTVEQIAVETASPEAVETAN